MRHVDRPAIRTIRFAPPPEVVADIEVIDLATMRRRAGLREFRDPQRPGFDLLIGIEHGATVHSVDLVAYDLAPGDTLWIHAGQVQQWGDIAAVDGPVALFTPRALDSDTLARIRATGMGLRSHFPRNPSNVPLGLAWSYLRHCASVAVGTPEVLGSALVARSLAALLLEMLAGSDSPDAIHRQPAEDYLRLREAIEGGFAAERRVAAYARLLGYSTRTLDRLARANAGLTAKALIDERVVLEAQRMLVHGEEPVAAIAAAVGFDDPSNFSKYFAHRAGSTPAAFRRGARGGNQMPLPDRRSPSKPTRRRRP